MPDSSALNENKAIRLTTIRYKLPLMDGVRAADKSVSQVEATVLKNSASRILGHIEPKVCRDVPRSFAAFASSKRSGRRHHDTKKQLNW